jgi:hypothetical protein
MTNANQRAEFSFYRYNNENNAVIKVTTPIICGSMSISIDDINRKYLKEYKIFYKDIYYWQFCENQKEIVQSRKSIDGLIENVF